MFAGPRGVGKTTTARILARGAELRERARPPIPAASCDACVEIAEGRDIDVLEIDAATHTGVDNVREVIIAGLGIAPVRNRYKIFIIDEVHQLSTQSFNALLKSIEEPPPHVVFMMATTELDKVPATIQSRSQVFELKTIGVKHDRRSAAARSPTPRRSTIDDAALMLIARAGEGSMRDAQSAFDQVIAFAGTTITADDVATVLGLVGRDLLLDIADGGGATRTRRRSSSSPAAPSRAATTCASVVPRAGARSSATCSSSSIDPSRLERSGDRRAKASASALKALAAQLLARGPDARVRRADEGRVRHPRLRRSRAITSRWRCCAGSTCASWCR